MNVCLKRAYETPSPKDGRRILVDRMWPRGLVKEKAGIDLWLKDIGPSTELRKWFKHEPEKWAEFKRRYFEELRQNPEAVGRLLETVGKGTATLIFGSREKRYNNAVALEEFLKAGMK